MHGERINIHSLLYSILISAHFQIFKMHYLLIHCNFLRWKFAEMKEKYEKDVCLFVHYVWIIKLSRNAWKWKFKVWSPGLKTEATSPLCIYIWILLLNSGPTGRCTSIRLIRRQNTSRSRMNTSRLQPSRRHTSRCHTSRRHTSRRWINTSPQITTSSYRYKVLDGPKDFFCKKKSGAGAAKKLASSSALLEENS